MDFNPDEIEEASYEIINNAPKIAGNMHEMKAIELSQSEREIFSESAALAIYGEKEAIPFRTERLLTPRRYEDRNRNDLWSTFNIVQENIMKGSIRGLKKDGSGKVRSVTTRKIKSIDRDVRLNKALWNLTEKLKELKTS